MAPWMIYTNRQRWSFLCFLFLVSASQCFDRRVIAVPLEPIKHESRVSDAMLGLLGGFCFVAFYAIAGIPVTRWADCGSRRTVITAATALWSFVTMCCGLAQTFWQLALARVGTGITPVELAASAVFFWVSHVRCLPILRTDSVGLMSPL